MENPTGNNFKFVQALVTTLRQMNIYPAGHPSIINSLKSVLSTLNLIFFDKEKFNLNISPDKALLIEGQPLEARDAAMARELVALIEKLGVEDLVFSKGITQEELDAFVRIVAAPSSGELKTREINKVFSEKGISRIVARQFSYLKVEKGTEAVLAAREENPEDRLKTKLKSYCEGALAAGDQAGLERELFDRAFAELKEKGKLLAASRNLLRRYFRQDNRQEEVGARLRQVLAGYGIPPETIDSAVAKIMEEPTAGGRSRRAAGGASPELIKENEALKSQVTELRRRLAEQGSRLTILEKENTKAFADKHRIDTIIHNLAEGMVVVDAEGKIILANPTAENMLGISDSDLGKKVKDVVRDEHLLTMTKDSAAEKDIEFVSRDESTRKVVRASSAVVEDENGNTIGMVTMLNDITRQKELEKMKTEFLSNVSHELRTPLVAIQKSVAMLKEAAAAGTPESQGQFLSIADRNLKRLTFLINDLLDLAKFEAGKMELKPESVALDKLVAECLESLTPWAGTKALRLERAVPPEIPLIWGDPNRLSQVLVNLVGNAIKFTPREGTITVSAARGETDTAISVTVADTGPGIPPEELQKVFDKFYQTKQRNVSDISGTGIGLAIVREIVALHGGRVWAESDGHNGAKFIFTLSTMPAPSAEGFRKEV